MKKVGWVKYLLHAAVLAGLVYAGMKYINGQELTRALHRFDWVYAPFILALSIGYVLVKGSRFVYLLRHLTHASRWTILRGYVAGQACTVLPGGMAARAGILEQAGVPVKDSGAAIAVSSLSDQAMFLVCALVSSLWFDAARKPVLIFLAGLTLVSILLGLEATRTWLLGLVEKILGRFKLLDLWRGFLGSMKEVATPSVLLGGLVNTAFAFALMVVALDLSMRGVGAQVPYDRLLLAFTLPTMLGRISAMPGGVGVTEAGMVGILDTAAGVTLDQAAAAVLIFRVGTVLFAALFGGAVYALGWHGDRERRRSRVKPDGPAVAPVVAETPAAAEVAR
uniref:Uncharacterized protein n=1 Tax=uncultured Armatimonadetes bacterium TaxID=157466 RepID=A0A6J4JQG3_9BACT|nr:hypothetical protein AVDCRST_MAG63-3881 [uncultured Armatimonadetes bacterium]